MSSISEQMTDLKTAIEMDLNVFIDYPKFVKFEGEPKDFQRHVCRYNGVPVLQLLPRLEYEFVSKRDSFGNVLETKRVICYACPLCGKIEILKEETLF